MEQRLCIVCGWRRVHARDRCSTCLSYLRKYKVDRPERVIVAQGHRIFEKGFVSRDAGL